MSDIDSKNLRKFASLSRGTCWLSTALGFMHSQQILAHNGTGGGGAGDANFDSSFNRGVDAGAHAVAEDGTKFEAIGVDCFALHHGNMVAPVMTVVFRAGAGAQGDMGADDRIPHITVAGNVGVVIDDGVFD